MRILPTPDNRFEYLLAAGWSEGQGPATAQAFERYVDKVARKYDAPIALVSAVEQARQATPAR